MLVCKQWQRQALFFFGGGGGGTIEGQMTIATLHRVAKFSANLFFRPVFSIAPKTMICSLRGVQHVTYFF